MGAEQPSVGIPINNRNFASLKTLFQGVIEKLCSHCKSCSNAEIWQRSQVVKRVLHRQDRTSLQCSSNSVVSSLLYHLTEQVSFF